MAVVETGYPNRVIPTIAAWLADASCIQSVAPLNEGMPGAGVSGGRAARRPPQANFLRITLAGDRSD